VEDPGDFQACNIGGGDLVHVLVPRVGEVVAVERPIKCCWCGCPDRARGLEVYGAGLERGSANMRPLPGSE
jgi:hypothetical protein